MSLSLAELRAAGLVGTRRMCRRCRRYTNFADGVEFLPTMRVVVCRHCGAPIDVSDQIIVKEG